MSSQRVRTVPHILTDCATHMDNIDIVYALLTTLAVAMMTILVNRNRSRTPKVSSKDPWGKVTTGRRASDYFYIED